MGIHVETLPGVGAEITGVDIAAGFSASDKARVHEVFAETGLVFFRDQKLTEQDHIALAQEFGEINVNRFFTANSDYPEIAMVTKEPEQAQNIGGGWHTDHSYDVEPALGSILVARELPVTGGDTWFSSMYKAYDSLSEGLKQTLEGLSAVHSAKHVFGSSAEHNKREVTSGRIGNPEAANELQDPVHPVVICHPLSGKKSLYVNPAFTLRFEGWSAEESVPLLSFLYEQAVRESNVTKFRWRQGSIAFWDNRATWHFAQNDYSGQRREMHRITINGCGLKSAS